MPFVERGGTSGNPMAQVTYRDGNVYSPRAGCFRHVDDVHTHLVRYVLQRGDTSRIGCRAVGHLAGER